MQYVSLRRAYKSRTLNGLACCFCGGSFNYFLLGFPLQSEKCINNSDAAPLPEDDSIFSLLFVFLTLRRSFFLTTPAAHRNELQFSYTYWHTDFPWRIFLFAIFRLQEHHHQALSGTKLCRIDASLPLTRPRHCTIHKFSPAFRKAKCWKYTHEHNHTHRSCRPMGCHY